MDDPFYQALGSTIAELRRAKGLTQEGLARLTRIGGAYVARIEAGNRKPTLDVLRAIAAALDVDVWRLLQHAQAPDVHLRGVTGRRLAELLDQLTAADAQLLVTIAEHLLRGASPGSAQRPRRRARRRGR
jgi:transcriptional regulator with XRE-family HTH domain